MKAINYVRVVLASPSSLRARIMRGSFWSLFGTVFSYGMAFAASIACAQLLGKTGFGELSMIRNTINTMGIFAGLGLGLTATKHVAEFREKDSERTARIIGLCLWVGLISGVVMTVILALGSSFIADNLLAAPHLVTSLIIGSLLLFVYAFDGMQKGILAGFEAYHRTAVIYVIGGTLTFVLVLSGAWFWGVNGTLGGFLLSASTVLVFNSRAIRKECRQHGIPEQTTSIWSEHKMLTSFSLPALLSGTLVGGSIWVVNTMLVNQPNGYDQMGIIGVTNYITMFAIFVPRAALQVLLPVLSMELNKEAQSRTNRRLLMLNSYTAFFLTTSLVSLVLYFVPTILRFYGDDFSDGKAAMVLVLCSLPILTYKDGIARFIQAKSFLWLAFVSNLVWAVFLLFGSYLLLGYGATGIALSTLCAYILNSIIFIPVYYKKLHMNRQLWRDATLGLILMLSIFPGAMSNFYEFENEWIFLMVLATTALICISMFLIWRWFQE